MFKVYLLLLKAFVFENDYTIVIKKSKYECTKHNVSHPRAYKYKKYIV